MPRRLPKVDCKLIIVIKSVTGALFKSFVKRNIKQFKYEHLEYLFQSVSLIVFSPNCSPDVCNALSESLEVAINRCEGSKLFSKSAKVMTENLQTLLANIVFGRVLGPNLAALTKHDIIGGCALLASLFRTLMSAVAVQHMVKNHTASILSLGWNLLQHVSERSPQPSDKILGSIAIRYFTKLLNEYFKQLVEVEAWEYFEKLLQGESGSLVDLMARILLEPASENSQCIFYPFGIEDIESNMNKSKATLIHIFQHFTNLTFSMQVFKRDPKNFAFYERWMSMTMRIIESTHLLGKRIPKEESCQGCLVAATNYMINICDSNEFYVIYQKSHRALIVDFILPHLVLTDREREDFERNEVEFCSYALDLVDSRQRNTETPKVRVAKLLDKLCIRIDGCLTFLIQTVFGLVDVVSQGLDLSAALSAHPILADVLGSEMFKKVGKMDILDMCLLTLAIVSNQILERADLK